jgi:divalent metal cation (Fe/Co/Zn/Cd) transporter
LLIGERAPADIQARIRRAVSEDPAVRAVTALHTMHVGPRSILVVIGVDFPRELTTATLEAAVERLHQHVREAAGGRTDAWLIVIEPARDQARAFGAGTADGVGEGDGRARPSASSFS